MAEVFVDVKGVNRVRNSLRAIAKAHPEVTDPSIGAFVKQIQKYLKQKSYPPKRMGQRYRRTGRLASSWRVIKNNQANYTITNRAKYKGNIYAPYVVGENQAWMHKGRWWIAREVIEAEIPKLTKTLTFNLDQLIRKHS